ncbi:LysR family transcriptional regulator [Psychrobacter sp. LV10R520-6]|uniref:LysR family transcriptional regulator n=1 Tax=Psychrobacter sp. LV10R520-6 TaxID=1415574 RepID=UPI0024C5B202|nr:LysR family transcriptional regulator [Psychrobacter sp. LV10R520-6]SNT69072.1 DNA-binding transcriptional regulator, LysR family [Psychrobacter sp. LV10R520-6]
MNGINRLDIKQLRVLQALLDLKNLSQVARKIGLTQQAISEQLRKLRDLFDDRLFIRQGNSMVPTPKALSMQQPISLILKQLEALLEPDVFSPQTYKGVFTISATDYATQALLPQLFNITRREAPGLKLIVRDFASDNINQLITAGELDLLITFPEFIPDNLAYVTLLEEQHLCITGCGNEFIKEPLTLAQIAAHPQLVVSPSRANLRGSHDQWFAARGLKRNIVMSVPSFSAVPDILHTTDMIAFYPARLLPSSKVKKLEVEDLPPTFMVIAAWHPRTSDSPIHSWLIKQLQEL